jgi:hypothetical protein
MLSEDEAFAAGLSIVFVSIALSSFLSDIALAIGLESAALLAVFEVFAVGTVVFVVAGVALTAAVLVVVTFVTAGLLALTFVFVFGVSPPHADKSKADAANVDTVNDLKFIFFSSYCLLKVAYKIFASKLEILAVNFANASPKLHFSYFFFKFYCTKRNLL